MLNWKEYFQKKKDRITQSVWMVIALGHQRIVGVFLAT